MIGAMDLGADHGERASREQAAWTGPSTGAACRTLTRRATRDTLLRIIDWMVANKRLTREQAYAVAAAAVDLRIGQLVDVPNCIVSAVLPLDIFVD
jgi:acetamidase/formamidase